MDVGLEIIERKIRSILLNELSRTGLLFRLFSRLKERNSIEDKLIRKRYDKEEGKLMQDLIGFRITTYFCDDLKIIVELCEKIFDKVELVYDEPETEVFKPLRKNMICKMPKEQQLTFSEIKKENDKLLFIDDTFEIQFRTTLSEGWHEVDHLMRYKCKQDWVDLTNESRMLNGIYASLETNDLALKSLFDDISYFHYKKKNWESMFRNKLRLRFKIQSLNSEIVKCFTDNPDIGRKIFKMDRQRIIKSYVHSTLSFPPTFDNWIYFINYFFLKYEPLTNQTPDILINDFKSVEEEFLVD